MQFESATLHDSGLGTDASDAALLELTRLLPSEGGPSDGRPDAGGQEGMADAPQAQGSGTDTGQESRASGKLSVDEERALLKAWQAGERGARDRLVMAHMTLVHQVARRYVADANRRDDMVQEGLLGLMRAAESFDVSHDVRFATYATYWIRSRIQRYLAGVRGEEFAAPASVAWACGRTRGKGGPRVLKRSLSLSEPVGRDGDDRTLVDTLSADPQSDPERQVAQGEVRHKLTLALHTAARKMNDPRTRVMIERRILSEDPATFAELGRLLNLSREGARLLERRLLERTRGELAEVGLTAAPV